MINWIYMISEKKLEQFGLSDKEAKVYKALLEMGQATAAELAIKSSIKRATTYVMLETLIAKGMISKIDKGSKTYFIIEDPLTLIKHIQEKKNDLDEQMTKAREIVPDLQMLFNLSRKKSIVRLLEGREGVRILQKDVVSSKVKHFDNISNINLALDVYPSSANDHRQDFYKKEWTSRVIFTYNSSNAIPPLKGIKGEVRRYLAQEKFPVFADIMIYGSKVSMITLKHTLIGIIIDNEEIAATMRTLFGLAWEAAEKKH